MGEETFADSKLLARAPVEHYDLTLECVGHPNVSIGHGASAELAIAEVQGRRGSALQHEFTSLRRQSEVIAVVRP